MSRSQQAFLDKDFELQPAEIKLIFKEFAKPIMNNVFFINIASLRMNSNFYNFDNDRWYQRPQVFCLEVYDEPNIYPVIMLVNNVKSFLEFVPDFFPRVLEPPDQKRVIIAPYRSEIKRILKFV